MPARLSSPNEPMWSMTNADVGFGDLPLEEAHLGVRKTALRPPAEVHDDLDQLLTVGQGVDAHRRSRAAGEDSSASRSSMVSRWTVVGSHAGLQSHGQRTPAGTSAGSATRTRRLLHEQRDAGDRSEGGFLQALSIGPS
jgi:hypothetical protein